MGEPFNKNLSSSTCEAIETALKKILPGYFGFHLLQIGHEYPIEWLNHSPIHHQIVFTHKSIHRRHHNIIEGHYDALPFQTDSVDLIVLPCILEQLQNPDDLLAESWRVLIPNGKLIIFGANPLYLLNLFHITKILPAFNIKKRLWTLGCYIDEVAHVDYHPAKLNQILLTGNRTWDNVARFLLIPLSGIYQIIATKQIVRPTPIKPTWATVINDKPFVGSSYGHNYPKFGS